MYPNPPSPNSLVAYSPNLSNQERGLSAEFGAGIARTTEPFSTAFANIPKSEPRNISVTSDIKIGLRKSGLSQPYFNIASSNEICGISG